MRRLFCLGLIVALGACHVGPKGANGAACSGDDESCESDHCQNFQCVGLAPDGSPCTSSLDCKSKACSATSFSPNVCLGSDCTCDAGSCDGVVTSQCEPGWVCLTSADHNVLTGSTTYSDSCVPTCAIVDGGALSMTSCYAPDAGA